MRKRMRAALEANKDASRVPTHRHVAASLKKCESHGLPRTVLALFHEARALRDFVNYGPDLRYTAKEEFRVFNRDFHPDKCRETVQQSEDVFLDAVAWTARNGTYHGDLAFIAVQESKSFFSTNSDGDPFYSQWSSKRVLKNADQFRVRLEEKMRQERSSKM